MTPNRKTPDTADEDKMANGLNNFYRRDDNDEIIHAITGATGLRVPGAAEPFPKRLEKMCRLKR